MLVVLSFAHFEFKELQVEFFVRVHALRYFVVICNAFQHVNLLGVA